jgi:two-component system sensor histidine kinase UhpB
LPALPHETELAIYRIGQEALTNAARHADADLVELSLLHVGTELVLTVVDDGRGMQSTRQGGRGAGIGGMYDRAAGVGGDLSITGRAGQGTTVRLVVPCESQDAR